VAIWLLFAEETSPKSENTLAALAVASCVPKGLGAATFYTVVGFLGKKGIWLNSDAPLCLQKGYHHLLSKQKHMQGRRKTFMLFKLLLGPNANIFTIYPGKKCTL